MSFLLLLPAAVILVGSAVDIVWTTVSMSGTAGPLSRWVMGATWKAARRLSRNHGWLQLAGVVGVVGNVALWVLLAVLGWSLAFSASPQAVVTADGGAPAGGVDRVYFAGFTVSTLGVGDYVPGGPVWRILTVVAAFGGLAAATLGITYLIAVTSAVVDRRTLALQISALGRQPTEMAVHAARDPRGWEPFERQMEAIAGKVMRLSQQHLAYPALHLFHERSTEVAAPVTVARLMEAVLLVEYGLDDARPSPVSLQAVRSSRHALMTLLTSGFVEVPDDVPPAPSLQPLRAAGLATVDDARFAEAVADHADARRHLLGYVRNDGWTWDDVTGDGGTSAG